MSLRNDIDEDYKKAIKNKEQNKTNTLRLIKVLLKIKIFLLELMKTKRELVIKTYLHFYLA